jgi:hypothetical protein
MWTSRQRQVAIRVLDSYASLLVLLLANFLLLELVDDPRWGAIGSTLLAAAALVVAISDPETGHRITRRHWIQIGACVALAPLVLAVNSERAVGLAYLLPVMLLVTATLPVTVNRVHPPPEGPPTRGSRPEAVTRKDAVGFASGTRDRGGVHDPRRAPGPRDPGPRRSRAGSRLLRRRSEFGW